MHSDSTVLYVSYNEDYEFHEINSNLNPRIWYFNRLLRNSECGVIEIFKNLPGVIIISVLNEESILNKISFNSGYLWHSIRIFIGNGELCEDVKFVLKSVLLHFLKNVYMKIRHQSYILNFYPI